jgi:endonuclease/exonuclease/phosphatase family metal-dependent hydrolase
MGLLASLYNMGGCSTYRLFCRDPTVSLEESIKICSFNMANARGDTDNLFYMPGEQTMYKNLDDIVRFANLENLDVLCLNEVDFGSIRCYGVNQAKYLADKLNFNCCLEHNYIEIGDTFTMGNAIISKHPIKFNEYFNYGLNHFFKGYIDATINVFNNPIDLVLIHLDSESEDNRIVEIGTIERHLAKKVNDFVLLGDFNDTPDSLVIDGLLRTRLVSNTYLGLLTYPSHAPRRSIDHIFVSKGLSLSNYHSSYLTCSDHRPVIADITQLSR